MRSLPIILLLLLLISPVALVASVPSNQLIKEAQQASRTGNYKAALIHLKNAAKKEPDNIPVKLALAELFIQTGLGSQAAIELDKALFLGANEDKIQLLRIKSQLIQGQFSKVTSEISKILKIQTEDIGRIRALQGQAYLNLGNIEKARSLFLRGSRLAPDSFEVKVGLARLYSIDNKNKKAKQLIESLYKQYPYNTNVLLLTGNLYREEHKYTQAYNLFKTAVEIQTGNTAARLGMITSLVGSGDFLQADSVVKELLSVDAEHETGNHLQAVIAYQLKNYTKALQAIQIIKKNNRHHKGVLLVSGSIYYQQGQFDAAETDLKDYLDHKPDDSGAQKILSAIYLKRNQGSKVIELLETNDPSSDIVIISLLSSAYKMIGNTQKSQLYLEKALKLAPDNSKLLAQQRLNAVTENSPLIVNLIDDKFENFQTIGLPKILQLLNTGNEGAIQLIKNYQKTEPNNVILHNLLGQAYLKKNELENAKASFSRALEAKPDHLPARISLARIAYSQGDKKNGTREYQYILRKDPNNETVMMDLAKISQKENNIDDMLTWLNKARRSNKSSIASRIILNRYYSRINEVDKALLISNELVDIQPQNIQILKLHADNLLKSNDLSQAIRIYKKIVELSPDSAQAYYWLASSQFLWKDYKNARKNFTQVIAIEPEHIISRNAIIKIDLIFKKYDSALSQVNELIEIKTDVSLSYETKGDILMMSSMPVEAINSYKKALSLQKNNYLLVAKIAKAYALTNQLEQAAKTFEIWIESHPENTKIRMMLAVLYQQSKQIQKAKIHYEFIIKKNPDNLSAINNLAIIYASLNDPKAFEYAEIAYSLAPENSNVLDTLGWLLLNNGEHKRALKLLKEGIDSNPSDFDLRYHYAVALEKNGFKKEAKTQLNMIVPVPGKFEERDEAKKLLQSL